MKEITFEITDYCPHECPYCSSNAGPDGRVFLAPSEVENVLAGETYSRINLSGGEPLSHPQFYRILNLCKGHIRRGGLVAVYTNAIDMILYNANVIEGVRVEANLTPLDNTRKIHILKRIRQGQEARRPDIHFSQNYARACKKDCGHRIVRPDGLICKAPCRKYEEMNDL